MKWVRSNLSWRKARMAMVLTSSLVLLSGCMVGPDFQRPGPSASKHYDVEAETQLAGGGGTVGAQHVDFDRKIDGDWWSTFGSAKLDQVMRKAIQGNRMPR